MTTLEAGLSAIEFGREICGDPLVAMRREWLVTNGLGGYASASVIGTPTRSYHGFLVAALMPPVERTVLVNTLDEYATYAGVRYPLSTHEFDGGTLAPEGYRHLESFRLVDGLPVWRFALGDAILVRRIWMPYGQNTTLVRYELERAAGPVEIEVKPLVSHRSFHALAPGQDLGVTLESGDRSVEVTFAGAETRLALFADRGAFTPASEWWRNFHFREETARGLGDSGEMHAIGTFEAVLNRGESLTIAASVEASDPDLTSDSLSQETDRRRALLQTAGANSSDPLVQQLVLAADQFLVHRRMADGSGGESIIAGYHWFNDWGRDTMIALPGVCLATGRFAEARSILETYARYVADGLLPNNFPDHAGVIPGYNTADATLWYVVAIYRYVEATGDTSLVDALRPVLREIVREHLSGTRYHIGVDPEDGLLHAGEPGVQLTWMDAKVGDWVVTPRIGKPVEINALWYCVLRILEELDGSSVDRPRELAYGTLADRVRQSFERRFRDFEHDQLADVVDGPEGDDWSMRPNQVFALSLPFPLLEGEEGLAVLSALSRDLLTSYGLRSLSVSDPAYIGTYGGDQVQRDGAYHQGTVWGWLLGPFAEAWYRLTGDRDSANEFLSRTLDHLRDAGLGSISEIFEGDAPFRPGGCVAQAWSVGETLRVARMLEA